MIKISKKTLELILKISCAATAAVALILSILLISLPTDDNINILTQPVSELGFQRMTLFMFWAVSLAAAYFLNFSFLFERLKALKRYPKVVNILKWFFYAFLIIGCISLIIQAAVNNGVQFETLIHDIHVAFAAMFGGFIGASYIVLFTVKCMVLKGKYKIIAIIQFAVTWTIAFIFMADTIINGWFTAVWQTIFFNTVFIMITIPMFIEKWDRREQLQSKAEEVLEKTEKAETVEFCKNCGRDSIIERGKISVCEYCNSLINAE